MQVIRTIAWIVITAILVAFIAMNWTVAAVNFWPLQNGDYLHFEWPVGIVALVFFFFGMVPVWLYLRAVRWRLNRRIETLEKSLQTSSMAPIPAAEPSLAAAPAPTPGPSSYPPSEPYTPTDL